MDTFGDWIAGLLFGKNSQSTDDHGLSTNHDDARIAAEVPSVGVHSNAQPDGKEDKIVNAFDSPSNECGSPEDVKVRLS